jgi:hypothetical protein
MARPVREGSWLDKRNGLYQVCWYALPTKIRIGETQSSIKA